MEKLQIFKHSEFGTLGTVEIGGETYFPATQCAKTLGYKQTEDAINYHCDNVIQVETPTEGGVQRVNYINEGDLYCLITNSRLSEAKRFKHWVFHEVLPEIRRTGSYSPKSKGGAPASLPAPEVMDQVKDFNKNYMLYITELERERESLAKQTEIEERTADAIDYNTEIVNRYRCELARACNYEGYENDPYIMEYKRRFPNGSTGMTLEMSDRLRARKMWTVAGDPNCPKMTYDELQEYKKRKYGNPDGGEDGTPNQGQHDKPYKPNTDN